MQLLDFRFGLRLRRLLRRQSMPSKSMKSWAAVITTDPVLVDGHTNRPRSIRLENWHSPSRHTRAALPDRRGYRERRTAPRNAGFAPEPAASSRQGRQNPCACPACKAAVRPRSDVRFQPFQNRPFRVSQITWQKQFGSGILPPGGVGPHVSLRRRFATPTESHLADITQLLFRSASHTDYNAAAYKVVTPDRLVRTSRSALFILES